MSYNIQIDQVFARVNAVSKNKLFAYIAEQTEADFNTKRSDISSMLMSNEEMVNSAIGNGVAVCGIKLPGLTSRCTVLATLVEPVEYGAFDNQPVDVIAVIFSPEQDGNIHLRGVSRLARLLKNKALLQRLREAADAETIQSLVHNPEGWLLAA